METYLQYQSKQNTDLLAKTLIEAFPDNLELQASLESIKNKKTSWVDKLEKRWNNLKIPVYDERMIRELNHTFTQEKREERTRNAALAGRVPGTPIAAALTESVFSMNSRDLIIRHEACWSGFDPHTNSYFKDPIVYQGKLFLENFEAALIICPESQAVNLISTIENLLTRGEQMGLIPEMYATVFLLFAKKYLSSNYPALVIHQHAPDALFSSLLKLINSDVELEKIRTALIKTQRTPEQMIGIPIIRIKALYQSLYGIKNPELLPLQAAKKCDQHALEGIQYLVSQACAQQYKKFRLLKAEGGDNLTLESAIDFISAVENRNDEAKLREIKRLPHRMSQLDLVSFQATDEISVALTLTDDRNTSRSPSVGSATSRLSSRSNSQGRFGSNRSTPQRDKQAYKGYEERRGKNEKRGQWKDKDEKNWNKDGRKDYKNGWKDERRPTGDRRDKRREEERSKKDEEQRRGRQHGRKETTNVSSDKTSRNKRSVSRNKLFYTQSGEPICCRCGSAAHMGGDCRRYPFKVDKACEQCQFMHPTDHCRFSKASRYQTPPRYKSPVSVKRTVIDNNQPTPNFFQQTLN